MNRRVIELVEDDGHLVLIEVELLAVELLKRVFFCAGQVDRALRVVLIGALFAANHAKVFDVAKCATLTAADRLKIFILGERLRR